jgi:hypothetical protein
MHFVGFTTTVSSGSTNQSLLCRLLQALQTVLKIIPSG